MSDPPPNGWGRAARAVRECRVLDFAEDSPRQLFHAGHAWNQIFYVLDGIKWSPQAVSLYIC